MKHCIRISLGATLLLAAFAVSAADRIGYVDIKRVLTESVAGKRARADIETQVKQKQEQINREGQKLKAQQEKLEKEQLTQTDAQKRAKKREFEQKVQAYQQLEASARRELADLDNELTRKVLTDIRTVIHDVAQQEKLMLVLEKNEQPVLYAESGPDLTDKVIKVYDAKASR